MLCLVAAIADNRVIGYKGGMPWHLPAELAYFKKITLGKTVLMGRRTFNSIGCALPKRRNWVITQQSCLSLPDCEIYFSLEAALVAAPPDQDLMVIGGASLYRQTLPLADRLYLSFIDCDVPGDTFFPEWDPGQWRETSAFFHPADAQNPYAFRSVQWDRRR